MKEYRKKRKDLLTQISREQSFYEMEISFLNNQKALYEHYLSIGRNGAVDFSLNKMEEHSLKAHEHMKNLIRYARELNRLELYKGI